jgi:broad specificity phosphatase PhoE
LALAVCVNAGPFLTPKRRNVRLIVVRHGLSCHNIIRDYAVNESKLMSASYSDPHLSECGIASMKKAREALAKEKIDFIGASAMSRSIEAAWHLFAYHPVNVLPHIAERMEFENELANKPMPAAEQFNALKSIYPNLAVNYDWQASSLSDNEFPSSYSHFESFLEQRLLPELGVRGSKSRYTIAIVTHGEFMRKNFMDMTYGEDHRHGICKSQSPRWYGNSEMPYPGQMLEFNYVYEVKSKKLAVDVPRGCRSLGSNAFRPLGAIAQPKEICLADFEKCVARSPFPEGIPLGEAFQEGKQCSCQV